MPATNVKSRWVGGDLVFYDKAGTEIFRIDGTTGGFIPAPQGDGTTVGAPPLIFRILADQAGGVDKDVVVKYKIRVIEAWVVNKATGGAGDTITVKNGATAITDAMDTNKADLTVTRAATIDDAQHEIAAGGTLRVTKANGANDPNCEVYVAAIRVA